MKVTFVQFRLASVHDEHPDDKEHCAEQDDSENIIASDAGMRNRTPRYARHDDTRGYIENHFQE